jgi:hypothetical protein
MSEDPGTTPEADRPGADRYRRLPASISPQDMTETVDPQVPADPSMGRDSDRDWMLRHA